MIVKKGKEVDHLKRNDRNVLFSLKNDKIMHEEITTETKEGTILSFDGCCPDRHLDELKAFGKSTQYQLPSGFKRVEYLETGNNNASDIPFGSVAIDDSNEATLSMLAGRTVVWNQFHKYSRPSLNGAIGDQKFEVVTYDNTHIKLRATEDVTKTTRGPYWWVAGNYTSHKVLIRFKTDFTRESSWTIGNDRQRIAKSIPAGISEHLFIADPAKSTIGVLSNNWDFYNVHNDVIKEGDEFNFYNLQLFDLTVMFGAGREPNEDQFKALFPNDYYEYSQPRFLNVCPKELKSVNKNLCTEIMLGQISTNTGAFGTNKTRARTDYIRVSPSTYYTFSAKDYQDGCRNAAIYYYDYRKEFISRTASSFYDVSKLSVITPSNCCYIAVSFYNALDNSAVIEDLGIFGKVQIERGSSATDYVAHEENSVSIDPTLLRDENGVQIFPYGLQGHSISETFDYISRDKAYKRMIRLALNGSESWTLQSINSYGIANFLGSLPNKTNSYRIVSNTFETQGSLIAVTETEGIHSSTNNLIYVRIKKEKADTVDKFKQWLSSNPIEVLYAREEYLVYDIDPITFTAYKAGTLSLNGDDIPIPTTLNYQFKKAENRVPCVNGTDTYMHHEDDRTFVKSSDSFVIGGELPYPAPDAPISIEHGSDGMDIFSGSLRKIKGINLLPWQPDKDNWSAQNNFSNKTTSKIENGVYFISGLQSDTSADTSFYIHTLKGIDLPLGTAYLSFRYRGKSNTGMYFIRRYIANYVKDDAYGCYGTCCKIFPASEGYQYGNSNRNMINVGLECDVRVVLPIEITKEEKQFIGLGFDNPNLFGIGSFAEFSEVMVTLNEEDAQVYEPYTGGVQAYVDENNNIVDPYYSQCVAPNGFRGINVGKSLSSYANYIDSDGKYWITDEVDYKRGRYIQRCLFAELDDSFAWTRNNTYNHCFLLTAASISARVGGTVGLKGFANFNIIHQETTYTSIYPQRVSLGSYGIGLNVKDGVYTNWTSSLIVSIMSIDNLADFLKYVKDNPIQLLTTQYEPIELPIPVAVQKGLMTIESAAQCMASVKKPIMQRYEVEQKIENGDFSKGHDSISSSNSTITQLDDCILLENTADKPQVNSWAISQSLTLPKEHRFYFQVCFKRNGTRGVTSLLYLKRKSGGYDSNSSNFSSDEKKTLGLLVTSTDEITGILFYPYMAAGGSANIYNIQLFDLTASGLDTILDTAEKCEQFFGKHYLSTGKHTLLRYPQGYSALVLDTDTMELKEQNAIGENPQYYIGDDGYLYKND